MPDGNRAVDPQPGKSQQAEHKPRQSSLPNAGGVQHPSPESLQGESEPRTQGVVREPAKPLSPEPLPKEPQERAHKIHFDPAALVASLLAIIVSIVAIRTASHDFDRVVEEARKNTEQRVGEFRRVGDRVTMNGNPVTLPEGPRQIQFWTPSAKTKEAANVKDWEKIASDGELDKFGDGLKTAGIVAGYRRYEVTGDGKGGRKTGAWWVASGGENFKLENFLAAYLRFWKPGDDQVYMEILPVERAYK